MLKQTLQSHNFHDNYVTRSIFYLIINTFINKNNGISFINTKVNSDFTIVPPKMGGIDA